MYNEGGRERQQKERRKRNERGNGAGCRGMKGRRKEIKGRW